VNVSIYAALLRSVNLAGRNKVPMPQLRAHFESLGFTNVRTLIHSGNVVFESTRAPTESQLAAALAGEFGFNIPVMVRTPTALRRALHDNPFPDADPAHVSIGFYASKPAAAAIKQLEGDRFEPERFAMSGRELYLYLPNGMGRTKLPGYLDRRLKVPVTIRTINTVTKLVELAT
jgi:uncharacterized protein (DUF1697 family)